MREERADARRRSGNTLAAVHRRPARLRPRHRSLKIEPLEVRTLLSSGGIASQSVELNPDAYRGPYAMPVVQKSIGPLAAAATPAGAAPSNFDLRTAGDVTSVKDQGPLGDCWSFATMASIESNMLVEKGGTHDFSENNLTYYHGFDWGPGAGGNAFISQAYLSRGSGPVNESDDPYNPTGVPKPQPQVPVQEYVRESLVFSTPSEIKTALTTYGALYTQMWMDQSEPGPLDQNNWTYYYSGSTNPTPTALAGSHAVTIVGWDDNKVTDASTSGAWLIKNSWGTGWGQNGYFWISYADTMACKTAVAFTNVVPATTFDKIYYYDTYGDVVELNSSYGFNAYTATQADNLSSVEFWTEAENAGYDVRVYSTFANGKLSGLLSETQGTEAYSGYHTVNLPSNPTPLSVAAGQTFYVYLGLTNGGTYPLACDMADPGYDSKSTASPGQSYYSMDG